MANISHSTLTDPYLHEPKGVAAAADGAVYVADGAGSGNWTQASTGFLNYTDNVTGVTITTPTAFTLVNVPSDTHGTQREYTHNSAGRLTYTGTGTISTKIHATCVVETSTTSVEVVGEIFINGSPAFPAQFVAEVSASGSGQFVTLPLVGYADLSTNDYIEVYVQASAGDLQVYGLNILAEGVH